MRIHKGLKKYRVYLRRADKHRQKAALCRIVPDEKRAYAHPRYDSWNWD